MLYVMNKIKDVKKNFFSIIFLVINDKNIFHHKSYKQEVLIDRDYFEDK